MNNSQKKPEMDTNTASKTRPDLREFIAAAETPIVSDGGMATSLYNKGFYFNRSFEELSLTYPESVREVTANFKHAGAQILTTNTFGATIPKLIDFGLQDQRETILRAAVDIALQVADDDESIYVVGAIGPLGRLIEPLGPTSVEEAEDFFAENVRTLHAAGVDGFSLEGFHDLNEWAAAVRAVRRYSDRAILSHISIQDSQKTNYGNTLGEYIRRAHDLDVDVIGIAGDIGPSGMLSALETMRPLTKRPISLRPNAGFPRYVNDQYIYLCNPDYLGKYAKRFAQSGANIIGGHAGVHSEHIRAVANAIRMSRSSVVTSHAVSKAKEIYVRGIQPIVDTPKESASLETRSRLGEKLKKHERITTIEIVPPRGIDSEKFLLLCKKLETAGIDFVNIPDGARAVARMSSTQLATYVRQKFNLEPIPHFTARDRNLLGLQSDLLGAHLNGVRNVLIVTGDPPKLGNCPGATGVYDVDSIGLTHIVSRLNRGLDLGGSSIGVQTNFVVGVALNPTASDAELEIKRFRYKIDAGADFAITQPIYDLDAYQKFFEKLGEVPIPIIMGVWPLVSLRNAEFLKNEVPGVSVPDWVVAEMEKAGDAKTAQGKDEAIRRGLDIAARIVEQARPWVAGFQISAPFNRVEIAIEVANYAHR